MPKFHYTALDGGGQRVRGSRECRDRAELVRVLARKNLRVLSVDAGAGPGEKKKAKPKAGEKTGRPAAASAGRSLKERDRILFFQMFGRLLGGGLSTGDAVRAISTTGGDSTVRRFAGVVWRKLSDGSSFGRALEESGSGLTPELVEVIHAGEATGRLEPVTVDVNRMLEDRKEIRELLMAKLSYPLFLSIFAFAVCAFLVLFLIPQVEGVLQSLRVEMTLPVRLLLGLSEAIFWIGPLFILVLVVSVLLWVGYRRTERGRFWQDRKVYTLPVFRSILQPYSGYHVSRTLCSLLQNGVDLTEALQLVERTITNRFLRQSFERARRAINDGEGVAVAFGNEGLLDTLSLGVLATHESIGSLDGGFADIAKDYRRLLDRNLNLMIKIFSGMAMFVAFSLVAVVALGMISAVFEVGRSVR